MKLNKIVMFMLILLGLVNVVSAGEGSLVFDTGGVPVMAAAASFPTWYAENFALTNGTQTVNNVDMIMRKDGTLAGSVEFRIETSVGGEPSGTLADPNSFGSILASSISTSQDTYNVNFTADFDLTNGVEYFFVVKLLWTSSSNRIAYGVDTTNNYPSGVRHTSTNSGSSWSETVGQDVMFSLFNEPTAVPGLEFTNIEINPQGIYSGFNFDVSSQEPRPKGITSFNNSLWVTGGNNALVSQYNSTTGTYEGFNFSVNNEEPGPKGITTFNNSFYVVGSSGVYKYLSNGTYTGFNFTTSSQDTSPQGITFFNNHFWVVGATTDKVYKYNTDGTYTGFNFSVSSEMSIPVGITGYSNSLWVVGITNSRVYKYNLSGNFTGVSFDLSEQTSDAEGITNNENGFQVTDDTPGSNVYQYFKTAGSNVSNFSNNYFKTIVLNTSTNGNVNTSYSLNGASFIQACTNNLTCIFNLTLTEGFYNISFLAENNESNVNSTNQSFLVDITPPILSIIGNTTQDTFFINFSTIFAVNYSISGKQSCTLNITYLSANESDSNFFIDCEATQLFSRAGLYNGFLTATDNAGNVVTGSVNGTINPTIDVTYFNEATTTQLFNFTVTIFHPDGRTTQQNDTNGSIFLSPVNEGELDLGLHTLEFIKPSFVITNNTFLVNATNAGTNVSYNITPVTLTIKMFNSNNTAEQLTFNVTIFNSTDSATFNNQFNFSKLFSEIPSGDITIVVSSTGFAETKFFNTINQFTSISISGLLIPDSIFAIIKFTTLEFGSSDPIESLLIEAQQFINGSFVTISQASTDGTGQTFMNLDVLENYKYIFTKDGFITATINAIPGTLEYTIRLKLSVEEFEFADGIGYGFTPSSTLLFIPDNFTFTGLVSGTSITSSSYTLKDQDGNILFTDTSTNPTGTTFSTILEITNTSGISLVTATITYVKDTETTTVSKSYQVTTLENASFIGAATTYGLNTDEESQLTRWFMMIFALAAGLLAGRLLNLNATGSGLLMVPIAGFFMFLGWMPLAYFSVLAAASLFFFIGGSLITR